MNFVLNQTVKTPIGDGVYQGRYRKVLADADDLLVRLPVNEQTSPHLADSNCITPRSQYSALFAFPASEVGGGLIVSLVILALAIVLLIALGSCGVPW